MLIPTAFCNIFQLFQQLSQYTSLLGYFSTDCRFLKLYLLVLLKSTEESFIADFRRWVNPFLERLGKRKKKSQVNLIHQYLTDVAKVC